jgi:U2 small nuclear ribonucleoprotein B''
MTEVDAPVPNPDSMEGILSTSETTAAPPSVPPEDEYSCETLYIQNLNEKIKPEGSSYLINYDVHLNQHFLFPVLKASLQGLFKAYGEVLDVVAHNNLRMRGQAFVSFPSAEIAKKAMKDVQRFPLYSKPMVSGLRRLTWWLEY